MWNCPSTERGETKWGINDIWRNVYQRFKKTENENSHLIQQIIWALIKIKTKESWNNYIVVKAKNLHPVWKKKIHYLQNNKTGGWYSKRSKEIHKTVEWSCNGLRHITSKNSIPSKIVLPNENKIEILLHKQNLRGSVTFKSALRNTSEVPSLKEYDPILKHVNRRN